MKSFGRFLSESVEWVREAEAKAAEAEKPKQTVVVNVIDTEAIADAMSQGGFSWVINRSLKPGWQKANPFDLSSQKCSPPAMQWCDLCFGAGTRRLDYGAGDIRVDRCTGCNGSGVVEKPAPADGLTDEARLAYADKLYAEWLA